MNKPPLCITDNQITAIINGCAMTADRSHGNYELIRKAITNKDWTSLAPLFRIETAVNTWSQGEYEITEEAVLHKGERLPASIERRVLGLFAEGTDFESLLKFHARLKLNPSRRAIQELYAFLEHRNIPIGEDGCFYAYKSVREDWTDHHSGKCDNHVGNVLQMPRNSVDDDARRGCSYGFHVGSLEYASSFGGFNRGSGARLLICKVDPADVVSVPHDCQHQKLRTCKYEVVSEYTGPLPETIYRPSEVDDWDDDEEEYEYDEDCWLEEDDDSEEFDFAADFEDTEEEEVPTPPTHVRWQF